MAGDVEIDWGDFTNEIAKAPGVVDLVKTATETAAAAARANAPVDRGDFRDSIHTEIDLSGPVPVGRVIADDPGALAIESRSGALARAARVVGRG